MRSVRSLCVDLDGRPPTDLVARAHRVARALEREPVALCIRRSSGGRGLHVRVILDRKVSPYAAVAAQTLLGSDPDRELYNLFRAARLRHAPAFWREPDRWNTLYSRKL